ncbi:WecB/TagA/CpsF family glycosyltransferase [Actinomadura macrotermitis]|uniref:UDP-N-acetyl-D-mannosaminuronic acid transferase n=1 Tax=Actinomadura macrotermitis TaxID=2585200 RepID=A0A7K0BQK5_9ACTN|nr:WecB/TagA/CpsF family glycosyltransferase [Actinomadura macrotermitis]MQY03463.1 UDP-N-acetyl-D-mannosaminuronic acid transferase [Actinomadura macrotermitis]
MTIESAIGPRRRFLGVWLAPLSIAETVALCVKAVEERAQVRVGVLNAAKIVKMRSDRRLREAVLGCDLCVADGQSVVWAGNLLGQGLPERVAGIDLMLELLAEAERHGHSVYFLGAREDVLNGMLAEVRRRHPALKIAGSRNGYFDQDEDAGVAETVRMSGADLLFIGVSSPKKEMFVHEWGARTGASVVHGVGGSFDVLAGKVQRAPSFWRKNGLEWLYRALQEPKRLGPRYLTTNTVFLALLGRELLQRRLRGAGK